MEGQQNWWNSLQRPYPGARERICDHCGNRLANLSWVYDSTLRHFLGKCKQTSAKHRPSTWVDYTCKKCNRHGLRTSLVRHRNEPDFPPRCCPQCGEEVEDYEERLCRCGHEEKDHQQLLEDGRLTSHFPCTAYGCECGKFEQIDWDEADANRDGRQEIRGRENMIETTAQLQQRFVEISEDDSFPKNFGTGENLIGLPPNDIYQLGFAAAFFECNRAVNQVREGRFDPQRYIETLRRRARDTFSSKVERG